METKTSLLIKRAFVTQLEWKLPSTEHAPDKLIQDQQRSISSEAKDIASDAVLLAFECTQNDISQSGMTIVLVESIMARCRDIVDVVTNLHDDFTTDSE